MLGSWDVFCRLCSSLLSWTLRAWMWKDWLRSRANKRQRSAICRSWQHVCYCKIEISELHMYVTLLSKVLKLTISLVPSISSGSSLHFCSSPFQILLPEWWSSFVTWSRQNLRQITKHFDLQSRLSFKPVLSAKSITPSAISNSRQQILARWLKAFETQTLLRTRKIVYDKVDDKLKDSKTPNIPKRQHINKINVVLYLSRLEALRRLTQWVSVNEFYPLVSKKLIMLCGPIFHHDQITTIHPECRCKTPLTDLRMI